MAKKGPIDPATKVSLSEPVTRGDFFESREEMSEFKHAVFELFETQTRNFERHAGALTESLGSEIRMLAESMKMQIEASDRRWEEQKRENDSFNKRIYYLEARE